MKNWKSTHLIAIPLVGALGVGTGVALTSSLHLENPVNASAAATQALSGLNEDFIRISDSVTPAVVSISMTKVVRSQGRAEIDPELEEFFKFFGNPEGPGGQDQRQSGVGSGVIVDAQKGYILTNNHVVEDADEIKVTLTDKRTFKAKIIGTDPKTDLAVIQVQNAKNLKQVALGDSSKLEVGEWVLAIGNPFGLNSTVTAGIISAKGRANVGVADFEDFIQTDAAINPGNSGGALVNIKGELVGINTAIATRSRGYMGIGFAIPSKMAQQVMESLIAKGRVSRSQLGVFIQQIDESMAQSLKLEDARRGILVTGVVPGSPADLAGFKKYDIILRLDGRPINDTNQFRNSISLTKPGTQIKIDILRNNQAMQITPTLKESTGADDERKERLAPELNNKMGFEAEELTATFRQQLNLPASVQGILVSQVSPASEAYEKGLRKGDVITELNRKPIRSLADYNREMAALKSGDVVLLAVQRQDGAMVIAYEID